MANRRTIFWLMALASLGATAAVFAGRAGTWLVHDEPRQSDLILVLAGETNLRPARALELLQQGYARQAMIDVPSAAKIYDFTQLELAEKYKESLPLASRILICPISGLSTRDEARDAEKCLAHTTAQSVLIVTSDFHTRRALSVFRHVIRGRSFSVAACYDPTQFGRRWWTRRQWAKTALDEGLKWLWWESLDRWR